MGGENAVKLDAKVGESQSYILRTSDEFYAKAREAIANGDEETAQRMINAALMLLGGKATPGEPPKRPDSEVSRVSAKLKEGWIEASDLGNALGISNSRLHAVLARIRGTRGVKLEKRTRNEYRIVD